MAEVVFLFKIFQKCILLCCSYFNAHVDYLQDLDMYYAETDTPAVARTSNLNEELGQVSLNLPLCIICYDTSVLLIFGY